MDASSSHIKGSQSCLIILIFMNAERVPEPQQNNLALALNYAQNNKDVILVAIAAFLGVSVYSIR